jgi:predicted neutral ceramidase superfamily lipid hydrolase
MTGMINRWKKTLGVLLLATFTVLPAVAQKSDKNIELKTNYVIRELKLNKTKAAQFKPLCIAYLKDMRTAKSAYSTLKDDLKKAIKAKTITEAQAEKLIAAHNTADEKEVQIKKKHAPLFRKVLSAKETYYAFDYAGDSMKKVNEKMGTASKKNKDEEDDD